MFRKIFLNNKINNKHFSPKYTIIRAYIHFIKYNKVYVSIHNNNNVIQYEFKDNIFKSIY